MSYCVNCGVELAVSEQSCPLCGVVVQNPRDPWKEPDTRPYPPYLETVMRGVDRRYFSAVAGLLLLIPVAVSILIDLFTSREITWSGYVAGAALVVAAVVLYPVGFGAKRPFVCLLIDTLVIVGYLWYIDASVDNAVSWFWPLALPISLAMAGIAALVALHKQKRKKREILISMAIYLMAAGVYTVLVELFIRLYQGWGLVPVWSWYALAPCLLTSAAFWLLNRREKWKESVRKRLFL